MRKSKPTKSMQNAASEGIKLFTAGNFPVESVTPRAVEVAKKIASGQDLSDDHINDMAHYHSSHDTCPKDCEDLLWGGPAGDVWARGKITQAMNTGFAEENIDFNKIISDKDLNLSLEIFSTQLDEPEEKTDDGLIWAPIARSGMLATRPGPNGEKLDSPLIFIPGHSENQRKEIGLQDIHDAFKDKAIEYVNLPIDTVKNDSDVPAHKNFTFQNTGFIKDTKIVDSKKIPGEKVLMGAHDFTEPDIKGKAERGTIPSRSCGLLYDYKNTTTGKEYPIVLDHVALTHKPWMGGMASYGSSEFSDSTVVPMMLSEQPFTADIAPEKPTKLAQEIIKPPQKPEKDEVIGEFLADVQWGDEPSYGDIERQINRILDGFAGENDSYPNYFLIDCTGNKALVKVDYGIGPDQDAWVVPYIVQDEKVQLSPFVDWIDVTKKWVSDTVDPKWDKEQLDKLKMSDNKEEIKNLYLSVPQAKRDRAKAAGHSLPDGSYPIENAHDLHSAAVLAASGHGNVSAAKALIKRRAKDLGVDINSLPGFEQKKDSSTKMSDPLKMASANRLGLSEQDNQPIGGPMTLLMSEEKMELLGLSDEAKEIQRNQNQEMLKMSEQLKVVQKKERETAVENKIAKYKEEGLNELSPGLLREFEVTALSDDGDIAVKLHLSENGFETTRTETATQIAERFIAAIPRKDGKVDLGEFANKTESPDKDFPKLKPDGTEDKDKKPATAQEFVDQMLAEDPSLKNDPEFMALSENGKGK
jgi:hypothetical protein